MLAATDLSAETALSCL